MPESKEQSVEKVPHRAEAKVNSSGRGASKSLSQLPLVSSSSGNPPLEPLLNSRVENINVPSWLRPFFSLRIQLTLVYGIILTFVVVFVSILFSQQAHSAYAGIVVAASVIVGTIIALLFTSLLLRPLWRVTDAAQAIAIGDLEQRERLPLRLPPQDEIDRLAGSLHEMVERLEYAEEMQRVAEQRFQRFFSDASHQLRTPLTSIRGFTEVLIRGIKDDPETAQRVLKRMKGEVERMTRLLNDILALARLDDSQHLKTQYVDLAELGADGIEQARLQANDGRRISLIIATEQPIGVQADKERLKQLLFILLDNAVKYGRPAPHGKIVLQLERQDDHAIIRVIDNGEGIAREDLDHIFESFYRGHRRQSSTSMNGTGPAGVGLGLTIASAIVRAHQGSITVCSDPDEGTEFRVVLPGVS